MLLAAIVALVVAVLLHEAGHLLAARRCGMRVNEYYLGFGPKLLSFRRGDTTYGVRLIPAGGFVTIAGMHAGEHVDPADEHRTFRSASFPRRALVLCAGSAAHLLLAVVVLAAAYVTVGRHSASPSNWEVSEVVPVLDSGTASPASTAGLQQGDKIVSVAGTETPTWQAMQDAIAAHPGQPVTLGIERDGSTLVVPATLATNSDGEGQLGIRIGLTVQHDTLAPHTAAATAVTDLGRGVVGSLLGLWQFASNIPQVVDVVVSPPNDPTTNDNIETRPVSVVGLTQIAANTSFSAAQLLALYALVNVFFAVFNMLPLLPLDGGHLAVATYERWRERGGRERHMVDMRKLAPLQAAGLAVFMLLGLGAVYLDIANPLNLG